MIEYLYTSWLRFLSLFQDRTFGGTRSSQWPTVRAEFLKSHPTCEACGRDKYLQVHHKRSFATQPDLELNPQNLIVLCEGMESNCHRLIGHLQNYKSLNETVETDAAYWLAKIINRPTWKDGKWVYPNK
jgi:hypothetical protein